MLWCAPESFSNSSSAEMTSAVDVYAFGIILYEIMYRSLPYTEVKELLSIPLLVCEGKRPNTSEAPAYVTQNPANAKFFKTLKTLMENCWHHVPSERPSMST